MFSFLTKTSIALEKLLEGCTKQDVLFFGPLCLPPNMCVPLCISLPATEQHGHPNNETMTLFYHIASLCPQLTDTLSLDSVV